jgi:hypothetical protein
MIVVALVALIIALDVSISDRHRRFLHSLEMSPTSVLEPSGSSEQSTYWHELSEVLDETTVLDRILLRRKIVVMHRKLVLLDQSDLTVDPSNAKTARSITLFDEKTETGYFVGTARLESRSEIPQDAVIAR